MADRPQPYGYATFQRLPERLQVAQWSALWELYDEIRDYEVLHPEHVSLGTHRALRSIDAAVKEGYAVEPSLCTGCGDMHTGRRCYD